MTQNNNKKTSVSPIIYNNGDRIINKKSLQIILNKEASIMNNNYLIDTELKELLLSDKKLKDYLSIYTLHTLFKTEKPKEHEIYDLNEYETYKGLIKKDKELKNSLSDALNDINDKLINNLINDYRDLSINEGNNIIYTLSRLFYLQNKYKDDEIGQEIDDTIKKWLEYIKTYDAKEIEKQFKQYEKENNLSDEEYKILNDKMSANVLINMIPSIKQNIINLKREPYLTDLLIRDHINKNNIKGIIVSYIDDTLSISKTYQKYNYKINGFINDLETDKNFNNFINDSNSDKEIQKLYKKYNIPNDDTTPIMTDEEYGEYEHELTLLFADYLKNNDEFVIQDNNDITKWRKKADIFLNQLSNSDLHDSRTLLFTIDDLLECLSYNEYQKNTYKLSTINPIFKPKKKKKTRLNKEQLKEKYKDLTLLNGESLDFNRKWARVDTSKINTNIIDLRESITKKTQNNTDITRRKLNELEKKVKPTKNDLDNIKELKQKLKEQEKEQEKIFKEAQELKADIKLIEQQILDETIAKNIKTLSRKKRKMEQELSEKEGILRNESINLQTDLMSSKLVVAEKYIKKTKESFKFMISNDYDIQNFNSEGRNFLYYIPNIPNIIEELDEDFITLDIMDYLDFTGRPNGNISRIRKNLQNTLKEMRKETYDYTYLDDKGKLHDDSLVLIGDIKGTEYKGKASIKVQLGATFKDNLKQAFIKSQYVKVNSNIFKIGQGRNNKAENMAKEIFLYLAKLCRIEAKKQVNGGKWRKDVHLETIITKLCELNLITYNPYRYNECVKEPLLYALNTGVELGYFMYKTDAFKYYDNVISSQNRGANVQDKIINFEKGDKYGIEFIINGDMVDLENNVKAHGTYNKYQKKYKATKK